jgi:hypothetical protein
VLDRERLAKVLQLTTSTNDSEALAAIRKANDIVKGEGLTWDEVLVQVEAGPVLNVHVHRNQFVAPEFYEAVEAWRVKTGR